MADYQATPEQWNTVQRCADVVGSADCSAILELRARVETLEAAAQKHIVETSANILALASRVETLEAAKRPTSKVYEINEPLQLTAEQAQQITDLLTPNSSAPLSSSNYPAKPDSSLVRRVALVISGIEYGLERDEEAVNWASEARAAIREVAAWMTGHPDHYFPPALVFVLEKEAE
jgi:hypothetical protein